MAKKTQRRTHSTIIKAEEKYNKQNVLDPNDDGQLKKQKCPHCTCQIKELASEKHTSEAEKNKGNNLVTLNQPIKVLF